MCVCVCVYIYIKPVKFLPEFAQKPRLKGYQIKCNPHQYHDVKYFRQSKQKDKYTASTQPEIHDQQHIFQD